MFLQQIKTDFSVDFVKIGGGENQRAATTIVWFFDAYESPHARGIHENRLSLTIGIRLKFKVMIPDDAHVKCKPVIF